MNAVTRSTWERLSPLLDEFLDLPESGRAGRMAELRAEDPKLADALAGMLQHLPEIEREGFMERPIVPPAPGLEGQVIGPYTLAREIGHGGMGTVWQARRTDGRYEGDVAFKFLRTGLFGHGDAARFEREGSILARLSHPHIARLLDAGVTHDGQQPYLVLEYIDGEPIDKYCERLALPPAARLKLFLDVLSAVAHAHNRLILHRDLKPSNILVTASGDVKLLDFGIAKLLDDSSGAGTAPGDVTALAGNAFTPEYAAPEQLQGGDVTTATDVYALGVLMYTLLGGDHPTNSPTGAPLDRMRAVIDMEPKRLSDSVLKRGGPTARYSVESKKLSRELRGDVDTIVARALKKKPGERYANAAELADDVRRYLAHEPIAARPDARLYRTGKFLRRHWVGVTAAGVAATALGVGGGVALWQAKEAQAQRVQAEGLIEYMLGDLRKKLQPVGRLDILDGVANKALAYYSAQDLNHLDGDSLGRRARTLHAIGDIAEQRGKLDEAQRDFEQAARTTGELLKRSPTDGQRIFDHSQSAYWLGYLQWSRGRLRSAEAHFREYYTLTERMTLIDPTKFDWQLEKIAAAENVAIDLIDLGQPEEALATIKTAEAQLSEIVKTHPEEAMDQATTIGWIAHAHAALGHQEQAIEAEQQKIATARKSPDSATNRDVQALIGNGHIEIALWLRNLGRSSEALPMVRLGLSELIPLTSIDSTNLDQLGEVIWARLVLGEILIDINERENAKTELDEANKSLKLLMARPLPRRSWQIAISGYSALLQTRLASAPADFEAAKNVLESYLSSIDKYELEGGEIPAEDINLVANAELSYGDTLVRFGRKHEAEKFWSQAKSKLQSGVAHGSPYSMTLAGLANLRLANSQEAQTWADRVWGMTYRHPTYVDFLQQLGPSTSRKTSGLSSKGQP
jgi:serine/threonine protein kinase